MKLTYLLTVAVSALSAAALPQPQPAAAAPEAPAVYAAHARGLTLGAGAFAGAGAGGPRIRALQYLLWDWGYEAVADGVWGAETAGAVAAFQRRAGVAADGVPGPATLGALAKEVAPGSAGNVVRAAQALLAVDADGVFGPATRAAAVAFQHSRGLTPDGIVGAGTWTEMFRTVPGGGGKDLEGGPDTSGGKDLEGGKDTSSGGKDLEGGKDTSSGGKDLEGGKDSSGSKDLDDGTRDGGSQDGGSQDGGGLTKGGTRVLNAAERASLVNPAKYASAAYCPLASLSAWNCKHCSGVPYKRYLGGGGDFDSEPPQWFVIETGTTLVVSVQGTVSSEVESWLKNADYGERAVPAGQFPGRPEAMRVHSGFYGGFAGMVGPITALVGAHLAANARSVLVTGHSKGAAVAQLVAASLAATLPDAAVTGRFFAAPRVGNQAWADYADSVLGSRAWHITNKNDIVPSVPPRTITAYRHMSGEVWLTDDGRFILCEGQENPACADSAKFKSITPHNGPYVGVQMADCNDA